MTGSADLLGAPTFQSAFHYWERRHSSRLFDAYAGFHQAPLFATALADKRRLENRRSQCSPGATMPKSALWI